MVAIGSIVTAMNRRDFGRASMMGLAGAALPRMTLGREQRAGDGASYRYVPVDVFTDRRLEGNQLLVFPQPTGLDADRMQALTRESNYSECTFVFPPEAAGSNYRARIFGPAPQLPFA